MKTFPKEFTAKCVNTHKNKEINTQTDYSIPFPFSKEVLEGKRKVICKLTKKD